ncbi:flagellar hook-length control protein FliK, partial [Pigmentiphaga sp. D-2]|uniref:flagellar hook-length control protein FliK n=1 Tax=Pigmentiphaga sp. D-2 TaxID=1002116 RepID=UPI0010493D5E
TAPPETSTAPAGVLQASATVPVNTPAPHHAPASAARNEVPSVPGAPVPLHAGALQDRIDTALRWMAGGQLQTAQLRVNPEALGPITIHLRLDGDAASVVFGSNHESTRQALESSLAGLKDVLAANGLSLGQASVGSEQQSGFLAARQFAEREAQPGRAPAAGAAASGPADGPAAPVARGRAAGNGMVDLYA